VEAGKRNFQSSFVLLLFFYASLLVIFYTGEKLFFNGLIFSEENFLNWDAMHYNTIRQNGYSTGMVAFFPLFPFMWKWTFLGPGGISVLNGLIYISSFAWLATIFQIDSRKLLLIASVPGIIFMFLPFSEAVFFLASTILLAGLKRNNFAMAAAGIVLSGLARPVATIFIPAILAWHFLSTDGSGKALVKTLSLTAICIASLAIVFTAQYFQTGDWLAFLRVQKEWGNYLRLPVFPLTSWAGGFILRLDALALFFGISAFFALIFFLIKKQKYRISTDGALIFSLCYLAFLSITILLTRGGVLNSLNRYLFCSAFFFVAMHKLFSFQLFAKKNALILFLVSGIFWLLFASYVHIQTILKFELLSLYLVLLLAITAEKKMIRDAAYYSALTCNIVFMLIFFHRFLSGEWVG
jgi:hypothetical protein